MRNPRTVTALAGVAATLTAAIALQATAAMTDPQLRASTGQPMEARIRVDQLGYLPLEVKQARLMTARPRHGASFVVVDSKRRVVLRRPIPARPEGHWNAGSTPSTPSGSRSSPPPGGTTWSCAGARPPGRRSSGSRGRFGCTAGCSASGSASTRSSATAATSSRDPSRASPRTCSTGTHSCTRGPRWRRARTSSPTVHLHRIGGPVDVAGGCFDAGHYLKFTHSRAYNDVLLFTSARLIGKRAPKALTDEARHGLAWLAEMWDARSGTLYLQVGLGSGNRHGTFLGDHDGWRLPPRSRAACSTSSRISREARTAPGRSMSAPSSTIPTPRASSPTASAAFQEGMVRCSAAGPGRYVRYDGHHSRYVDDVRSWQTDEPALDMTGAAVIAAAAELRLHPHHR